MSLLDVLKEIIDIPSVTGDEDELCTWVADRYDGRYPIQRIGNSVIVGDASDGRPFYGLYGHLDTVPVQGDPSARIEGDRLVGLGVSDMKSGVAVMLGLLDEGIADNTDHNIVGVFYDKEEGRHDENGLEAVLDEAPWLLDSVLAIVMEPTDLHLEMGCNGVLNADIVFRGSSAHSARPWLGENAVTKAGGWLAKMHAQQPDPVDIDGLIYREVFSVTRAEGGIANNIIPPEMVINLNHRFPPIYSLEEAEARLRAVAEGADEIRIKDRAPSGSVPSGNPHATRLGELVGGEPQAKQGWTDVARLTSRGADAVNYGPGEVAQAHQVNESMPIENLDHAYEVMRRFLNGGAVSREP